MLINESEEPLFKRMQIISEVAEDDESEGRRQNMFVSI